MKNIILTLMLTLTAVPAFAQRAVPPLSTPQTFVEDVDAGAPGDLIWVSLRDTNKTANDLVIYDKTTGAAYVVINYGPLYGFAGFAPGVYVPVLEVGCGLMLRPGLSVLLAHDADGDGREDLIGHDKVTGAVVRYFRRGDTYGCQP